MKKYLTSINILSMIYSFLLFFGTSYHFTGSAKIIFDYFFISVIIFIIFFLLMKKGLLYLYKFLDDKRYEKKIDFKSNKFKKIKKLIGKLNLLLKKRPFLVSWGLILVFWLPYIVSFYPAILSPDPSFQIRQYFGIPNKYSDYSIMLDENVLITNHHPVIHTLLLGTSLKIGNMLGNDNFGLFIYSFIQILILSSILAYTIKYMTKENVSYRFRFLALFIYCLVPMFPMYAMSAVKDTIYSALIILYTLIMYHLVKTKDKLKFSQMFGLIFLAILIILFRNNGYYVLLISFPFLFVNKINLKKLILVFCCLITFNHSYNNVILPYFRITPSSVREMLSIPFQQTARYVKNNMVVGEEYEVYDNILDMSDLAERYNPNLSDPVKNKFNKYTTTNELKEYFVFWFRGLLKDPVTYIDATINNVYGYFYPVSIKWYLYYSFDDRIVDNGFNYYYNSLEVVRNGLVSFGKIFVYIPLLGFISTIGFNTWVLFFMIGYFCYRKKYKSIIYLIPAIVTLLVCVASPVNAYFRYAMPYIFSMPMIIGLFVREINYEKR